MTPAIHDLADFAHDLGDVPTEVRTQAALSILDTVGCMLAGSATKYGALIVAAAEADGVTGPCSIAGTPLRVPPRTAARCNGYFGDIFELNDLTGGHASIGVVTAALAQAEAVGASGADLLDAAIAGIEVTTRIYNALYPTRKPSRQVGVGAVSLPNSVGSAAAAARLLGLDRQRTREALAIAAGTACWSPSEVMAGPGNTMKPLLFGAVPASIGLEAAQYASVGMTGPRNILESPIGYFTTMATAPDLTALYPDTWALAQPRRKWHAACGYTHSALDAVLRNPAAYGEATRITLRMAPYVLPIVGSSEPPDSPHRARFHVRYLVAVAAIEESAIELRHSEDYARYLAMPEVNGLLGKITVEPDESITHYHRVALRVEQAGAVTEDVGTAPKGSPQNPMSDAEVIAKFRKLACPVLGAEHAETLASAVTALDGSVGVAELSSMLG